MQQMLIVFTFYLYLQHLSSNYRIFNPQDDLVITVGSSLRKRETVLKRACLHRTRAKIHIVAFYFLHVSGGEG